MPSAGISLSRANHFVKKIGVSHRAEYLLIGDQEVFEVSHDGKNLRA
jgi:hypothetical protein